MIEFGLPKRELKQEDYPNTPVIVLEAYKGKGCGNRFTFNNTSIELLDVIPGLSKVYFAVDKETKEVYIGKYDSEESIMLTKSKSISKKKFYDYIIKNYELDNTVDNPMELTTKVDLGGVVIYKLTPIVENTVEESDETGPFEDNSMEEPNLMETGPHNPNFREESIPHGHWDDV